MSNDDVNPDERLAELKRLIDSCGDLLDDRPARRKESATELFIEPREKPLRVSSASDNSEMRELVGSLARLVSEMTPMMRTLVSQSGNGGKPSAAITPDLVHQNPGIESAEPDPRLKRAEAMLADILGEEPAPRQDTDYLLDRLLDHARDIRQKDEDKYSEAEHRIRLLTAKLNNMEKEASSMRACLQRERDQAYTDPLTSMPNRIAYDERVSQEYARWSRYGSPLSLVVWDIDYFKRINDEHGHNGGDAVLRQLSQVFKSQLRRTDFTSRWGGEEFVTLMPETPLYVAFVVAEKLRLAVQGYEFQHDGKNIPVTVSAGVAQFHSGDTAQTVFNRADEALYRAKDGGRNQSRLEEIMPAKQNQSKREAADLRLVSSKDD